MAKLKFEKKQRNVEKRQKVIESRRSLASVRYIRILTYFSDHKDIMSHLFRVVQKNLVFVIGLSPRLADPEVLKKNEYFGKFGRIYKVVINNHTVYNGAQVNHTDFHYAVFVFHIHSPQTHTHTHMPTGS